MKKRILIILTVIMLFIAAVAAGRLLEMYIMGRRDGAETVESDAVSAESGETSPTEEQTTLPEVEIMGDTSAAFSFTTSTKNDDKYLAGPGGAIILKGDGVADPANIKFKSEPDLGYEPKWYPGENGAVYGALPVSADFDGQGITELVISLYYNGEETDIIIPFADENYNTLQDVNEAHFASDMEEIIAETEPSKADMIYLKGAFADPVDDVKYKGLRGFGRMCDGIDYRHIGVDIKDVTSADSVYAGAAGEVVYVGTLSGGEKTVVIYHGLDIYSWYVNMNALVSLEVGDTVNAGEKIGVCLDGKNLHCSITVGDVAVSPYLFWHFTSDYTSFLNLK